MWNGGEMVNGNDTYIVASVLASLVPKLRVLVHSRSYSLRERSTVNIIFSRRNNRWCSAAREV